VTQRPITITAGSATRPYNGTALTSNDYTFTGTLAAGQDIQSVTILGTRTDVGSSSNIALSALILDSSALNVTANYQITYIAGTLTVTPATLALTAIGYNGIYDAAAHDALVSYGVNVDDADVTYGFSLDGVTYTTTIPTVTNVADSTTVYIKTSKPNYGDEVSMVAATVQARQIAVTADSATKEYDGTALTAPTASVTTGLLVFGHTLDATVVGSQTSVGSSGNVVTVALILGPSDLDVTANYSIQVRAGTLTITPAPVPTIYTVTFVDWNGALLGTSSGVLGFNATAPANPTRAGYNFTGWDRAFTNVTSNLTVTATYTLIPVIPFVPFVPFVPFTPVEPVVPPVVTPTPAPTPIADAPTPLAATPTPTPLPDPEPPLAAPIGAWALINLILAVLAFVCMIALVIHAFTGRRKSDAKGDTYDEYPEYKGYTAYDTYDDEEDDPNEGKSGLVWRILGIIAGIVSPILFFLTEDITLPMILTDAWTLWMLAITVIQLVAIIIFWRVRKPDDDNEDTQEAAA
jgi:hypothetical protein